MTEESRAAALRTQPSMRLVEFRAMQRNTLHGFATVELRNGLVVRDLAIHEKGGRWWVSFPARPVLDAEGRHIANHGGHKQYAALLGWRDRDLADRFSAAVIALIREVHPGAFGDAP